MTNATTAPSNALPQAKWQSLLSGLRRFAVRYPLGVVGAVMVGVILLVAIAGPMVAGNPLEMRPRSVFAPPSLDFPFGTDKFGRDMFSRVMYGAGIALKVALLSVTFGVVVGTIMGVVSGYFRGVTDLAVQRVVDGLMSLPTLLLALALTASLGINTNNAIIAIGIVLVPQVARVARSSTLSARELQYVDASIAVGAGSLRVLAIHILPNIAAPIIVLATASLARAVLIEASLSFLGFGTPPPDPSWGADLSTMGRRFFQEAPWLVLAPGLAITVTVLGFNLLGDALRDVLDPRLRKV